MRAFWILKTDAGGRPVRWIDHQAAANYLLRDEVAWSAGGTAAVLHGGVSAISGERSVLMIPAILAIRGERSQVYANHVPVLSNPNLFRRDRCLCAYCGDDFTRAQALLTRDHVVPVSRGGRDVWTNVVTACRACNEKKADRLLSECRMQSHYLPYEPSLAEGMILRNRRILADQMSYLVQQMPRSHRERYAA